MAAVLTPSELSLRGRLGAHALHSQGKTNTSAARAAFRKSFEIAVDPDMELAPAERAKRAEHAYKAHMTRLSLKAAAARRRASTPTANGENYDNEPPTVS